MKTSVKKCIRAASNLIVCTQSHSICQTLGNFSGVEFLRTVSKFRKKGDCFVFMSSTKCEIRLFHVIDIVVQRQQRNVEKSVMHVQSCCFANVKGHSYGTALTWTLLLPVWKLFTSAWNQIYGSDTSRNPLQSCLVFHSILELLLKTCEQSFTHPITLFYHIWLKTVFTGI